MKTPLFLILLLFFITNITATNNIAAYSLNDDDDPLPSWNDGALKQSIIAYVKDAIDSTSTNFIPANNRIAVFDNDGTLWAEQPLYFQFFFAFDRIKQMATQHPEWTTQEPFKSILGGNIKAALASGQEGLIAMIV